MTKTTITVIHCWSAPRSRSTALLYTFEARGADNCVALDEALYREWLISRGDLVSRPYLDALIRGAPDNTEDCSPEELERWKREVKPLNERIAEAALQLSQTTTEGVVFCKQIAKFYPLYNFQEECTSPNPDTITMIHKHVLLIRDPVDVLSSWGKSSDVHGNNCSPDEVGCVPLLSIYSALKSCYDHSDVVKCIDADELVADPEGTLRRLCQQLSIPFKESMLSWQSGPHACDGPWAKWWYANVHKSTGWKQETKEYYPEAEASASSSKYRQLHPSVIPTLKVSCTAYQYLSQLTHTYQSRGPSGAPYNDERNANLLVWVGAPKHIGGRGRLVPRDLAAVSPWDSAIQGGDACWEEICVRKDKLLFFQQRLKRLEQSTKALGFENVHARAEIQEAIFRTLAANGMRYHASVRVMLTRGEKYTSSIDPKCNVYGTTLIVLAEWKQQSKQPVEGSTTDETATKEGITLITASQRRNPPSTCDSKIHHNNMINTILPKIQTNHASATDAIMLDMDGFVCETSNSTNMFMVDEHGALLTPSADHCYPGIAREIVLRLAKELDIATVERRMSLAEFHAAEEVFTTGEYELIPVTCIDGRTIGCSGGPVTQKLQEVYCTIHGRSEWATDIPPFL